MLKSGVLAAALLVSFASNALADRITLTGHPDYRNGPGGEFNITGADAAGAALLAGMTGYITVDGTTVGTANGTRMNVGFGGVVGFQTFCLEYNEGISLGGTYNYTINTAAFAGGVGGASGSPLNDPISVGTAYLYSLFASGGLAANGYNYTNGPGRAASATLLQNAFWYLEQERSLADIGGGNVFLTLALNQFSNDINQARANNSAASNVRVINLTNDSGSLKQSQLILVPDGGVTLMLLGFGLSGLALLRRKSN